MPDWNGILRELSNWQGKGPPFDPIRRKYLASLYAHTHRNVILYATDWTTPEKAAASPSSVLIVDEDLQGIMTVVHGLEGTDLDLVLHSPGGSPYAAEALVHYLREKFHHIRVIIPSVAMSAATMMACAADEIVMGKHSFLGPIDPQLVLHTSLGDRNVPAAAILDQFDLAKKECQDPQKLAAWLPMLDQYGPDLLVQCKNLCKLSEEIVRRWLRQYSLSRDPQGQRKAARIAKWLADHKKFKSHGRHISRDLLEGKGLHVAHLEDSQVFQDLALSVFHATAHTFSNTSAVKIIENHLGKAFIKKLQVQVAPTPAPTRKASRRRGGDRPPEANP